ncbi:hypothetical protein D3C76_766520 [compost metagenome]
MPQRQGIDHRAGAERGDKRVDFCHFHQQTIQKPEQQAGGQDHQNRRRPGKAVAGLQADHQDVPKHNAVANGQIDLVRQHGDHRCQGEDSDDHLVAEDRVKVKQRRKGIRQQHGEKQDQQQHQYRHTVNRQ